MTPNGCTLTMKEVDYARSMPNLARLANETMPRIKHQPYSKELKKLKVSSMESRNEAKIKKVKTSNLGNVERKKRIN